MSSAQRLREFIQQRLTAAAEEIFTEFGKTIVRYEEEIDRQRRLLDISCKPETELHTTETWLQQEEYSSLNESTPLSQTNCHTSTDLPHQHVCNEEEFLTGQQLCNQERSFSLVQEEPEPPQIAEEQEELCRSEEEQQLVLKEETDAYMVTATYEESDHSGPGPNRDQLLSHSSDTFMFVQSQSKETEVNNNSVQYEDGVDHERRQVDITRMPIIKLHRMDLPEQEVCKEEDVLADPQLCHWERNSSLDQEEPEPPQTTEEQEELCSSWDGEQLVLKEETDAFMVTATYEESDHSKPELNTDQLLSYSSPVVESQDQKGSKNVDLGSTRNRCYGNNAEDSVMSARQYNSNTGKKPFKCDVCGKAFKDKYKIKEHYKIHTGEKRYTCKICGKSFRQNCTLTIHMRMHTGERPFPCETCGKMFTSKSNLSVHKRIHTGEKPYRCKICGKMFKQLCHLLVHQMIHTGERPYHCQTCGKTFSRNHDMLRHMKIHTRQKSKS